MIDRERERETQIKRNRGNERQINTVEKNITLVLTVWFLNLQSTYWDLDCNHGMSLFGFQA